MVAHEFLSQLDKLHFVDSTGLDDFADRCTSQLSFLLLVICFTIVSLKSYVFEPLSCYSATTFSGSNLMSYINAFCWANGTVAGDVETTRLDDDSYWNELEKNKINYYQWVSLVLALQAILCYLPRLLWEGITFNRVGTNLNFLIETAQGASKETGQARKSRVKFIACSIDTMLFARRAYQPLTLLSRGKAFLRELTSQKRLGRALCVYYFLIKLAHLGNAVIQLVIMQVFLGMKGKHTLFGVQILLDMWKGRHWTETLVFPRIAWCRVPIKLVGNQIPTLVAQCTLPVNMLNEKVYVFLWFWFVFVATLQSISIVSWAIRLTIPRRRFKALVKHMRIADSYDEGVHAVLKRFEINFLRADGSFLLQMIRLNAGEIVAHEILLILIDRYLKNEKTSATAKLSPGVPAIVTSPACVDPEKLEPNCDVKQRLM